MGWVGLSSVGFGWADGGGYAVRSAPGIVGGGGVRGVECAGAARGACREGNGEAACRRNSKVSHLVAEVAAEEGQDDVGDRVDGVEPVEIGLRQAHILLEGGLWAGAGRGREGERGREWRYGIELTRSYQGTRALVAAAGPRGRGIPTAQLAWEEATVAWPSSAASRGRVGGTLGMPLWRAQAPSGPPGCQSSSSCQSWRSMRAAAPASASGCRTSPPSRSECRRPSWC